MYSAAKMERERERDRNKKTLLKYFKRLTSKCTLALKFFSTQPLV